MEKCKKCGKELDKDGKCVCDTDNAKKETENKLVEAVHEAEKKIELEERGIADSTSNALKGFFSSNPTRAIAVAVETKTKLFIVLGLANIILCGLAIMMLPSSIVSSSLSFLGSGITSFIMPKGLMFLMGALLGLLTILVWSLMFKITHLIYANKTSFVSVLNVVTAALLPFTVSFVLAVIFSLFAPMVGVIFILLAAFVTTLMMYVGLQKQLGKDSGPVWLFVLWKLISIAFLVLFITQIMLPAIISNIISNITYFMDEAYTAIVDILKVMGIETINGAIGEITQTEIFGGIKVQDILDIIQSFIGK